MSTTSLSIIVESDQEPIALSLSPAQIRMLRGLVQEYSYNTKTVPERFLAAGTVELFDAILSRVAFKCAICETPAIKTFDVEGDQCCARCAVKSLEDMIDYIKAEATEG